MPRIAAAPALVGMHRAPLDNVLLELLARVLEQDLHRAVHVVLLHDLPHQQAGCIIYVQPSQAERAYISPIYQEAAMAWMSGAGRACACFVYACTLGKRSRSAVQAEGRGGHADAPARGRGA